MPDAIVDAIREGLITTNNISFDVLRQYAGRDCGVWDQLGRGRAILDSVDQLDQYLYTYGPMTKSQWSEVLDGLSFDAEPAQIVDYGCGQGLAIVLMFDHFGREFVESVEKVVLIEPSSIALTRAVSVIGCYSETIEVVGINKRLEDVS